tara:strand:- start:1592 stop:2161 length:570 start_codon:yes stop_codon:yes gene_type:complete
LQEKKLIKNLRDRDEKAFKFIVDKYKNFIFNISVSIIQNTEEADDLTQEVFIQIYKSINKFKEKSSLSTWIYRITLSKCYEHIRFKKRKKRFSKIINLFREDGSIIDIPVFNHPGIILEKKEEGKMLFEAINSLNEEQKSAYILKNIQGLSYKKISEVMKKSTSSIESLIFRAKKNLKKYLEKKLNDKK